MGQRHCRVAANLRRSQLVGVHDVATTNGAKVARQLDVPFYDRLDDLLDRVDAVSIATPTPDHAAIALRCIERGIHVLIEKPIAETVDQAVRITEAAENSGLVVLVGHIERFNPAYSELKNVLESLDVLAINFRRLSPFSGSNIDVDVVADLMVHDANLALDLMAREPAAVETFGVSAFTDALDHVVAHLTFENGPLFTMTASRVTEQKFRSIEVTAREAYLECDLLNKSIAVHRQTTGTYLHRGSKYKQESTVERIQVPIIEPQVAEFQHFVECVLDRKQPLVSARDGLNALRLTHTIRSACVYRLPSVSRESEVIRSVAVA
jgi:predicted dehydrogenase